MAGCLFNTKKFIQSIERVKQQVRDDIPFGLSVNPDAVLENVLWNVEGIETGCAYRSWYDSRVLLDENKYASALKLRLGELSGDHFEQLMSLFFSIPSYGFSVNKTQQTHDKGVDLFLSIKSEISGKLYVAVQCKRQDAPITEQTVGLLRIAMNRVANVDLDNVKPSRGILVTTSRFTLPARQYANEDGCIHLIDGDELSRLFFQHAEQSPGMWTILDKALPNPIQHNLFQPMKSLPKPIRSQPKNTSVKKQ